ncbi:zinc finger MYND domain-containing protein 11-like [Lucilia cuprina]|uniref:zinc finger MYND domain-containing protein 11-like n=1 Tax=Lucilia cuprina TaxID=7375 RepID=UPI001F052E36|nr:zinc finger MYND domain-containing protein 11-like [Lucilia cuprina]
MNRGICFHLRVEIVYDKKEKNLKTKPNNKLTNTELATGTAGLDEEKKTQNEERVKKKRKIKEIYYTKAVEKGEENLKSSHLQQPIEENIKKKKPKEKNITEVENPKTVLETCGMQKSQQYNSKICKKLNVKRSSKKCSANVPTEIPECYPPQNQQGDVVLKKKVKGLSISPAETDLKHHSQEQQQSDLEHYQRKAYIFMKTLKKDYKRLAIIYNSCLKAEQERIQRNEQEIDELKKQYNQMQVERTNIKRKRWCRYCESEATYLSTVGLNFYCSQSCEQKQNDLVSAMEQSFQ